MWLQTFLVFVGILYVAAIKIPVENTDNEAKSTDSVPIIEVPIIEEQLQVKPIYYSTEEATVDGFFIPPNSHKPEAMLHDTLVTPATFLLPPALDTRNEYYYKPTEPGEQTDWYPIAASPQKQVEVIPIIQNERQEPQIVYGHFRNGKILQSNDVPVPSRDLQPPREDAPNDFIIQSPSIELELPAEEIDHTIINYEAAKQPSFTKSKFEKKYPRKLQLKPGVPVPYITPPKNEEQTYKNPTLLYPKKFHNEFRPIPIPISQINEEDREDPTVRGEKPFKSVSEAVESPVDEKKVYLYEKAERKRKLKGRHERPQSASASSESKDQKPLEQETSETHYREPERDAYPSKRAPLAPLKQPVIKSNGERTEFRMHGMKGPHSYQFGYDTGKGKNRQFRYEERDNDGHVRGHYGYVDKFGKLRVVNYDADPEHGFRAEAPVEKE